MGDTMIRLRHPRPLLAGAALLVATVVGGPFTAERAHAQYTMCRSDPVVSLLNLGQLDLSANISDSQSDVQKIVYAVHVPAGTHLLSVINTDTLLGLKETVQFYADDVPNTFDTYTTVYTGQSKVAVTAGSTLVSPLNWA
jgi:hypothetical protein